MFNFIIKKIKSKNYYMKILAAVMVFTLISACFSSCSGKSDKNEFDNKNKNENEKAIEAASYISYINDSNSEAQEQRISDLYENAGVKDKIIMRDMFNLALSHNNYFYTSAIYVEITSGIEDAEIYYSLDNSIPSKNNVGTSRRNGIIVGSREYSEPIYLETTENNSPYILKFIAYSKDMESRVFTHTYFVSPKINERFDENTFVFCISAEHDDLYGYENGILIEGKLRDEWKKAHPRENPNPPEPANFNIRGREGEREAYVEVFKQNGQLLISQTAGLRVHGGWSRANDRKSLALYARTEYDGIFDRFYYPFFENNKRNDEYGSYIYDYKTLLLRNGANDRGGAFMREEFGQSLAKQAGFLDYKPYAPAAVFVNGEYYGFFWLQNFYHESDFISKYGGDNKNSIEIVELWEEPKAGNLSNDTEFEKIEDMYDLDNFMLYYAFEIYGRNWDWPHNNRKLWRYSEEDGAYINKYYDGKLRMLLYDVEGGWGDGSGNNEMTIQRIKNDGSAPMFTALMRRADMQEKFCCQMFDLFNTVFVYENMEEKLNEIAGLYDYEIGMAIKKKVLGNSMENIKNGRKSILRFAQRREVYIIEDMIKSFKLSDSTYSVNAKGKSDAEITLNTLKLSGKGTLSSRYFTEHSVMLKAEANPGYLFDYWEINGKKYDRPEIKLSDNLSSGGVINAEVFMKPDESYYDIVINTIRLDENCDMIVLLNPGANETIIENLYLSNDKTNLQKFHIKKVKFPPKSIMTYYGRNYADYTESLNIKSNHIFDFKIKKGETVYLSDKNGKILKEVYIPENFNTDKNEEISRNGDGSYKINKIN